MGPLEECSSSCARWGPHTHLGVEDEGHHVCVGSSPGRALHAHLLHQVGRLAQPSGVQQRDGHPVHLDHCQHTGASPLCTEVPQALLHGKAKLCSAAAHSMKPAGGTSVEAGGSTQARPAGHACTRQHKPFAQAGSSRARWACPAGGPSLQLCVPGSGGDPGRHGRGSGRADLPVQCRAWCQGRASRWHARRR